MEEQKSNEKANERTTQSVNPEPQEETTRDLPPGEQWTQSTDVGSA
mgnify:CR=1 FL=1